MKINKLKIILIAVFCLVINFFSEIQGMEMVSNWYYGTDSVKKHSRGVGEFLSNYDDNDPSPLIPGGINKEFGYDVYNKYHKRYVEQHPDQAHLINRELDNAAYEVLEDYHRFPERTRRRIANTAQGVKEGAENVIYQGGVFAGGYAVAKADSAGWFGCCPKCNLF